MWAVNGENAKSGRGAGIPLRADLAADLREHLDEKLSRCRRRTLKDGRTEVPAALPTDTKVLHVPRDLIRIIDRDLAAAGVSKKDPDAPPFPSPPAPSRRCRTLAPPGPTPTGG